MATVKAKPKHDDGTPCPEGTRSVPRSFDPCCETFEHHTRACYFDIRYEWWPKLRGWFIVIAPRAGGGGIGISFCPHCGSRLAGGRAGRWLAVPDPSIERTSSGKLRLPAAAAHVKR